MALGTLPGTLLLAPGHSPDKVSDDRRALSVHSHSDVVAWLPAQCPGLGVGRQDQPVGAEAQVLLLFPLHPDGQVAAHLVVKDLPKGLRELTGQVKSVDASGF